MSNIENCEQEMSPKDYSFSARCQRRKPIIGEKSNGGKLKNLKWNDGNFCSVQTTGTNFCSVQTTGTKTFSRPTSYSQNILRVRKNVSIPELFYIKKTIFGPENQKIGGVFEQTLVVYNHKKSDIPKAREHGKSFYGDVKNNKRRKSTKGKNKGRVNYDSE